MSAAEQLLNALKETLRSTGKPKRFVAEVAAVLAAYAAVDEVLEQVDRRWQMLLTSVGERHNEAERAAALARTLLSRARDLRGTVLAVRDRIEGVRLTALTAGLEGTRLAEPGSGALARLSDEVRSRALEAMESLDELVATLEQLDRDREKLREATGELTRELGALEQTGREGIGLDVARKTLRELGAAIERATGTDPELAPLLAAAAEHARGLAAALSQLGARDGARLALRSLQPLLEPLVTVLGDIYGPGREDR